MNVEGTETIDVQLGKALIVIGVLMFPVMILGAVPISNRFAELIGLPLEPSILSALYLSFLLLPWLVIYLGHMHLERNERPSGRGDK